MIAHERSLNGFSITELLVGIALVTTAVAGSFPLALSFLREEQTTEAARSLASHFLTARIKAVQSNAPNGVTLSLGYPRRADVYLVTTGKRRVRDWLQPVPSRLDLPNGLPAQGAIFNLPTGFRFEPLGGPFNSLIFRSDGTVEGTELAEAVPGLIAVEGMDFVIKVKQVASGRILTVLIRRTGLISIRPGDAERSVR